MNTIFFRRILVFTFLVLSFGIQAQESKVLTKGKLENGLTYYIHNSKDNEKNCLYLLLNVGSINEEDNQLGYAHFLEHMAFEGGKRLKNGEYVEFLEKKGLIFGRDLNAFTSQERTIYKIEVPIDLTGELVDNTFTFFADILDGLNLESKGIDKQKKIVIQEMKIRSHNSMPFLPVGFDTIKFGNSRFVTRNIVGSENRINGPCV